jgi:hypothetical protein
MQSDASRASFVFKETATSDTTGILRIKLGVEDAGIELEKC